MIVYAFEKMVGAAGYTVCSFTTYLMFIQSIFFHFHLFNLFVPTTRENYATYSLEQREHEVVV
jgi:hypothetical protein